MVKFFSIGLYLVIFSLILGPGITPASGAFIIPLVGVELLSITNLVAGFLVSVIALTDYAVEWITPNMTKQELREADLSQLSFDVKAFGESMRDLRRGIKFDNQMYEFEKDVKAINLLFDQYNKISPIFDPTLSSQRNNNDYIYKDFRTNVFDITNILKFINVVDTKSGLADIFFEQMKSFNNMCQFKLSQMQRLTELFGLITITEQKALQILKFAHKIGKWITSKDTMNGYVESNTTAGFDVDQANDLLARYSSCVRKFLELFAVASTEIQSCDPVEGHIKDVTYTELEDVFQQYIISEASVYPIGECPQNCSGISNRKITKFLKHPQTDKFTFVEDTYNCNGYLRECKILNNDNLAKICISNPKDRRYDFAILEKNDNRQCSGELKAGERINRRTFKGRMPPIEEWPTCPQCECTCENGKPGGNLQYFSLTESYSTQRDHYVATGIRFHRVGDTIQLQIQEGQVLPYGKVNASTLRWKETPIEKNNRVAITYDFKKIALDKVMVPDNFVVTGVKLDKVEDILRLKVFYQSYDRILGKISSTLISNMSDTAVREEVQQPNHKKLAINIDQPNNEISGYEKFISFRPSGLEQDGGQTTVPLIDVQNVTSNMPTPLSGIGITHRRNLQSSEFLGLSIFTFNIVAEISEEKLHLESS